MIDDPLTGPLRGELLGMDHLAERAQSVARAQHVVVSPRRWRRAPLLARLEGTQRILRDAHRRLSAADDQTDAAPAGAWLLDNYHVVEEHIQEARAAMPRGYYRKLPELSDGPLHGYPRVYELALTLISHTEGRIDREIVDLLVGAAQDVHALTIGELWAIPVMLRLGLIESVRRMALRTVRRLDELDAADRWAARILGAAADDEPHLTRLLHEFVSDPPPLGATFVARLLQQLRSARGAFPSLQRFEQWMADEAMTAETAAAQATQRIAVTQLTMANSITSLRAITQTDWPAFVERQSRPDAVLREDPAGVFARMTFATRDRYRHVVEHIARATGRDEQTVARRAVDLARAAASADGDAPHRAHVGYYLIDDGRAELERATEYRPSPGAWMMRQVQRHPDSVLSGSIIVGTLTMLAVVFWLVQPLAWPAWLAVILLAFVPANDIAVRAVNQILTALLPPDVLPKLDLTTRGGVPAELRTAVVVPTLLGSVAAVDEALEHLEVQFLANRDPNIHFALLSDFTDAPAEHRDGDDDVVTAAVAGVRALNARYAPASNDAFYLFHRPRRWNPQQGVWMGWERKRGKLGEFNRFLRNPAVAAAFSTIVGEVDAIRGAKYVITLDADTVLPPGAAAELIGTLAHPLNRARFDPARGRVTRGYGILQPRVNVLLPSAHASRFAAIQSGHPGVDPYSVAVSDVYQDLYREGSFTGKGIYDVDAFEQATHGRFPENTLLSHDLIEGSYARAGLASDISIFDEYPARYLTFTRRKHRWIRGDWQLLRWLAPRVPGPDGPEPNRLSRLSRWRLFDNLRRSTVEIAQLTMLIAGWTLLPGSVARWTAAAFAAVAAPWIVALLLAALRPPFDKSWRAYYAAVWRDAITSVQQVGLTLVFLPHQAWISADAIVRTLWRLVVTRRHLLEWQTASVAERTASTEAWDVWRAMWPAPAGALAILAAALLEGGSYQVAMFVLPLAAVWAMSPALAHWLSVPTVRRTQALSVEQAQAASGYARAHWRFFERFMNEETHWLPPDNFQEDPKEVVAMRTSPTNIGLALLATVSAHDLGFLSLEDTVKRLELTFATLERLPRFRGHFYNWYDLADLSVLQPAYVSTVDSGNLAGHLLALRQACLALAADVAPTAVAPTLPRRLRALATQAYDYASAMDFRLLFDTERELFSIGYQPDARVRDASYYDLLASEARLASFVAIAKGDVPVEHWFRLGRTLTHVGGSTSLVSWSGSMFEFLMPLLVMKSFPATLLDQTYQGAVDRHVAYGDAHGVPWGISESAYNVRDRHLTYQYRAFGIPELALKRGLGRDLVIAPYASALAMMVTPDRALENMARLDTAGALGEYGFRDALDYTRPAPGRAYAVVGTFMAHHVGMTLVALTNALTGQRWQQRFHADPLVQSVELLLHERIPHRLTLQAPQTTRADSAPRAGRAGEPAAREIATPDTPQPRIALLGIPPYTLMISHAGGGYSRYEDLAVTRWRADGTRDNTGQFCYVKDVTRGRLWSAAHQPVCAKADWYTARLASDRVTFHRADGDIETRTEIAVVPEDAAEVRRVTVVNNGDDVREIELTSYGEIVLAPPDADRAHPAFSNLFVETEWHEWCTAVTATRRPRSPEERQLWCVHVVDAGGKERVGPVTCETDRARFVGRGRSTRDPRALAADGPLSLTVGAVLDPVFALRTRVRLAPRQTASVAFTTLVATSRERAFELADRYHEPHAAQRALDLAWTFTEVELQELGATRADATVYQELAGHLLYANPALRGPQDELLRNKGSQPRLWANGISGDWPILFATIESADGLPSLRQLLAAHHFWRRHGLTVDLVVVNEHPSGYLQELTEQITSALFASTGPSPTEQPGGVFVRRADQMNADDLLMLRATARVHVPCDGRPLGLIVGTGDQAIEGSENDSFASAPRRTERRPAVAPFSASRRRGVARAAEAGRRAVLLPQRWTRRALAAGATDGPPQRIDAPAPLTFDNGTGGLTTDGAYQIRVRGDEGPPAPWSNIVANPHGGFLVTERGAGFAWSESSYFYRLTPWFNDPVSDPSGDALYLRDDDSGEVWSATPAPVRTDAAFTVRHRAGASTFEHTYDSITTRLTVGLADDQPVKLSTLRVVNDDTRPRRISVTAFVEWALGVTREHTQHQVRTEFDENTGAILARNFFDPQFAHRVAFLTMSEPVTSHTGDRREFLGRNGSADAPAGLTRPALSGTTGAGFDPCGALQCQLELEPGESRDLIVALGSAADLAAARQVIATLRDVDRASASAAATRTAWNDRLGVIQVRTPEPSFDAMLNRWTLYQALSCRMWARSALYQSSGAYGFRDQLQDVMAFVYAEPALARAHILRAAARQFIEGDVQHWWHPESGRGVRTRFSDDLAWLPYVVDHYVRVTGDATVLDEVVPFLAMRPLEPNEHELFDAPATSDQVGTVYEHCLRALRKACTRGAHGLPLMGGGDWNDGMNRVGADGSGESVWLAWFLITVLRAFAPYVEARGDTATATDFRARADAYAAAADAGGWDGAWYRRAYFDDGTPLGSRANDECRIDSIAQSWSVISGAGTPERQRQAMDSMRQYLVREDARAVVLLTPPFDHTTHDPGYIKGYLPGVRENGAQYTHAALWAVLATALQGDGDGALALYQMLNPLTHAATAADVNTYETEPYVVAADVYTAAGHVGRGGWTWYTGSASWMYRVGLEAILGFTKRGNSLVVAPCVPDAWPELTIEYRFGESVYTIRVEAPGRVRREGATVLMDGRLLDGAAIPLVNDGGRHEVVVWPSKDPAVLDEGAGPTIAQEITKP